MSDFYVNLAFSILFQVLSDSKQIKRFAKAFRKAYIILHSHRLVFLKDTDQVMLDSAEL